MTKNPDIEDEIWQTLKQEWRELEDAGHTVEVTF